MPRKVSDSVLDHIFEIVRESSEPVSIDGIHTRLSGEISRRTLQQRLAILVEAGRIQALGRAGVAGVIWRRRFDTGAPAPERAKGRLLFFADLLDTKVREFNLRYAKSQAEAKCAFKAKVYQWAARLEVRVNWLGVRNMKNKWASCSTNGNLNFNLELLDFDEELQDYVIVHELLHFSVPNHGKLWKSLMTVHLGNYKDLELRLPR